MDDRQSLQSESRPQGTVTPFVIRDLGELKPRPSRLWRFHNLARYRWRSAGEPAVRALGRLTGLSVLQPQLSAIHYRPDPTRLDLEQLSRLRQLLAQNVDVRKLAAAFGGSWTDYGVLSTRFVTDVGVAFIVDAFQNLTEVENMQFHGYGTGTTAENQNQTALVTELTTEYATDNTRPTGSRTESAANIYRSVATLSPDGSGTLAITEHGIFSQAATGGGVMLDRSVFAAVNLTRGADSLQTTYDLTFTAGG